MTETLKRKHLLLSCILTITVSFNCFTQSVYTLDPVKDIIIGSASLGLTVSSFFVNRSERIASGEKIPSPRTNVNPFDRNLMFKYNKTADIASDIVLYGLMATPFLSLAGNLKDGNAWITYGVMYAQSVLLVFGTCEIIKNSIPRYRPYCYFGDIPSRKETDYFKSFPSRHTAFAFMSAGFLTTTFYAEYPNSRLKIPLGIASYSFAAAVGLSRIFSGSHFLGDVLAGAALGSVFGYLIPNLHFRKTNSIVTLLFNGFVIACKY
jgi:membrane-associated phospholipid phosphatase